MFESSLNNLRQEYLTFYYLFKNFSLRGISNRNLNCDSEKERDGWMGEDREIRKK